MQNLTFHNTHQKQDYIRLIGIFQLFFQYLFLGFFLDLRFLGGGVESIGLKMT